MNKFKLYIAAVAVGFMPAVAFCLERSPSPLEKIIPGYQAAQYVEHKMNVNPYARVESIPRVESDPSSGENEEGAEGGVTCLKKLRQLAANGRKILTGEDQQAGMADPAR